MLTIYSSHFTNDCATHNFDDQNQIIFYNFVGNFIPPEWSDLSSHNGKILSKTARQLLSLIVFRLQIYHNNSIDELKETYLFFQQSLGACQERIRQCLFELQKSGFIQVYNATNLTKTNWDLQLSPISVTLIPYQQEENIINSTITNYTDIIKYKLELQEANNKLKESELFKRDVV
ncbi:hypothetical protein [Rickettsia gravesii]|uniref:hypothetical protein n=1 Tax=Rickettsia gravesii TaxID=354585 RepID=UPI0004AF1FA1